MAVRVRLRAARYAAAGLCAVVGSIGLWGSETGALRARPAVAAEVDIPHAASAHAATTPATATRRIDPEVRALLARLNQARSDDALPLVTFDEELSAAASEHACSIARGEHPLTREAATRDTTGTERGNVGLVVDRDLVRAAGTMHDWWSATVEHRGERMDPDVRRYGVGVCDDGERVYFVERLTPS